MYIGNQTSIALSNGTIDDPYTTSPSLEIRIPNAPIVIYRPNGHISATGDPIHSCLILTNFLGRWIEWRYFQFYQTIDGCFHRRLLPAPSALMKINSGIARFPCHNTAFFSLKKQHNFLR